MLDGAGFGFGGFTAATRSGVLVGARLVCGCLGAVLLDARLVGRCLGIVGILLRLNTFGGQPRLVVLSLLASGFLGGFGGGTRCGSLFFGLLSQQFGLATLLGFQRFLTGAALGFLALGGLAGCLGFGLLTGQRLGFRATLFFVAARLFGGGFHRLLRIGAVAV